VSDPPLVTDTILRARHPAEYRRLLLQLISEPEFRADVGAGLASQVREAHSADRWLPRLEAVYERLGTVGRVEGAAAVTAAFMATRVDREVVGLPTGRDGPLAVAETLVSYRGELRSLKSQVLLARVLLRGGRCYSGARWPSTTGATARCRPGGGRSAIVPCSLERVGSN